MEKNKASFKINERDFQGTIEEYAQRKGWLVYSTFNFRANTKSPGFPDLVMVRDDKLIFAELKAEKGKLTPAQQEWMYSLEYIALCFPGAISVYVFRPSQWSLIEGVLN